MRMREIGICDQAIIIAIEILRRAEMLATALFLRRFFNNRMQKFGVQQYARNCLATGSIWGKPMWGTWWDWDPRLTSELVLLFLYLGVIGLNAAIEDRRAAARAAGFLAIVGVVLLPIIRYSVEWWNSLHQGATIKLFGESTMDSSMTWPLWVMVLATKFWFIGSLLQRARADNLERESGKDWARAAAGVPR